MLRRWAVAAELGAAGLLALWVLLAPIPSRRELGRRALAASEEGWKRQVERFTRPSLSGIGGGGWVELRDAKTGKRQLFGPGMYVECQAYDMLWFLHGMSAGMGRPEDYDLEKKVVAAVLKRQDPVTGHWPWSDDGCIHEQSGVEMTLRGERESGRRALEWVMKYAMSGFVSPDGYIPETEGRHIIKSWGEVQQAPAPGGAPVPPKSPKEDNPFFPGAPDELPMILRLVLLHKGEAEFPEVVRRLRAGLERLFLDPAYETAVSIDFIPLYGMTDYGAMVHEGILPRDRLYDIGLANLRRLARGESIRRPLDPLALGIALAAVCETDIIDQEPEVADRLAESLMSIQDSGGEWPMPVFIFRRAWFLWQLLTTSFWEPHEDLRIGRTVGEVDGFPTYVASRALREYACAVLDRDRLNRCMRERCAVRRR